MNRKRLFLAIIFTSLGLLLYGGSHLLNNWRFQRSFTNEVWHLDERRTQQVHYAIPPNWEANVSDEVLLIRPKPFRPDATVYELIWLRIMIIPSDEFKDTDISNKLEEYIPSYFTAVKNFKIVDWMLNERFDVYDAVTTKIYAEWFTSIDTPLVELFEREGIEPMLFTEHELTLVDYDGTMILIDTTWRVGDPEFNSANYQVLQIIRESIQLR